MSIIGGIAPEGLIAVLHAGFNLMAEMTGAQGQPTKVGHYANYFASRRLDPRDVLVAIDDIMGSWQKPYWPSPEKIAEKASQIASRRRALTSAGLDTAAQMEIATLNERETTWERRQAEGDAWCAEHYDECLDIARLIDEEVDRVVKAKPTGLMASLKDYRNAWREGAVLGAIFKKISESALKAERLKQFENNR